jgi:hypothetical protein
MPTLCVVPSLAFPQIDGYGSELFKDSLEDVGYLLGYGVGVFKVG